MPAPDADAHHAAAANLAAAPAEMGPATWPETSENAGTDGAITNTADLTAAHPWLPIGTRALVENVKNGQFVVVRIDGRSPPTRASIIDLSKQAAERIDMIADGTATVRVRRVAEPVAFADISDPIRRRTPRRLAARRARGMRDARSAKVKVRVRLQRLGGPSAPRARRY